MKVIKWLGERYDAGPVRSIIGPSYQPRIRTKGGVVLRALVALGLLALFWWSMFASLMTVPPRTIVQLIAFTLGYSALGYSVRPWPDWTVHRVVGGWLTALAILLFPGQFLADATVDLVRLIWQSRR